MAASQTISRSTASPPIPAEQKPTDRFLGRLLLLFFLALYLLTGSGHGYSPDGEFAFRVAGSLLLDPDHRYLKEMRSNLYHWGIGVSVLAQPLALLGNPLSNLMPQKDTVDVGGRSFLLGYYRAPGFPDSDPTVGPAGGAAPDVYRRDDLPDGPATSLSIITFLADSLQIPQGTTVAEIELSDGSGVLITLPLRAGVETAEWSLGSGDTDARHEMARIASVWSGNPDGRNYYAELPFGRTRHPKELRVRYLLPEGRLYLRSAALLNRDTGDFQLLPSDQRFWSERENADLFARLFFSPYNAIVTAPAGVLVFALARLLGYSQVVSVVAALIYGLATTAWPYAKYDFSEPTMVLLALAALYLIYRWGQSREERSALGTPLCLGATCPRACCPQANPPGAAPWTRLGPNAQHSALSTQHSALGTELWLLLAGLTALALVATKYTALGIIPILLLQIVLLHWEKHRSARSLPGAMRPVLLFCAPFLLVAAPAVWYLSRQFGYFPFIFEIWAGIQRGWLPLPYWIGLRGLLFSPGRSFFLYSPPTVLVLLSVIPFVRRHGVRAFAPLAITLLYFSPLFAMRTAWHAGAGWGPRYQVLVVPLVVLMLAPLIQKAVEKRRRWARYALLASFLLGVGLQLMAVSKSFDLYLGIFRNGVVGQLPDQGAPYGGADYYPYSAGLDQGNAITATVWAWPFSPILAQAWLLSADILDVGPPALQPGRDRLLASPPWRLWGIDAVPDHPDYGLGLDFWSVRLKTDFPSHLPLLAGASLVLLLLEALLLVTGVRLTAMLFGNSARRPRAVRVWIILAIVGALLFNALHLLY